MENEKYVERLVEVEQRAASNTHRIDELEKQTENMSDLITSIKVLALRQENVETDLKEIKDDVKTLATKSGKRWDSVVETIIGMVVSALVAFMLVKMGLQ